MIIPFFIPHSGCPHQCVFCNQKNITGRDKPPDVAAIPAAIDRYLEKNRSPRPVSVAFYGGSFTALSPDAQKAYLGAVQPFLASGAVRSIALSTRPDCITADNLKLLNEYRVETVELGVQSLNDEVLRFSGRGHTAADTVRATALLRQASFRIGLQLMPGLPGDSAGLFRQTVEQTAALKPDFVRIYPALVVNNTPLADLYRQGKYIPLSLEEAVDLCKEAFMRFEQAGITIVRMGLQPTEELEKPGIILAGPYHPAFRQLVESSILLDRMKSALSGRTISRDSVVCFLVHQADLSSAIGQKRSNVELLKKEFGLNRIIVQTETNIPRRTAKLL